jgi:two-component system, response regulator YesN
MKLNIYKKGAVFRLIILTVTKGGRVLLKILIVDDEVLERKVLTKIINSSLSNVMVIGEAPNGRKAIEMAKEKKPDIIFMDIKMPGIHGVQAVKEIKKFDMSIRFIMVSAFNTFEYAKEVMQLGVKEYILKPSSKQDILESFQRVADEILEERKHKEEQQSLRENLDCAVSIAQKEWVSCLLINQVQDIAFVEWSQLLGIEITYGYIMLFSLLPGKETNLTLNEKQNWYKWLKDTIKSVVKRNQYMIGPIMDTQVPVLFLCSKKTKKVDFKINALDIIRSISTLFQKNTFEAELRIGVGSPYNNAYELNQSYQEAAMALQKLIKSPNRRYLFCDQQGTPEIQIPCETRILQDEKKLLDAVRQGDENQVLFYFNLYVKNFTANKNISSLVKKSFDELFIIISRMLHEFGINYNWRPAFEESEDMSMTLEKGKTELLSVVNHVQLWRNNQAKGMLNKAKEFIETHYADSITLELVAEYMELSPFYLSKFFKDRYGMNFIDYLTEIRIQHAKEEMVDQGKSLKEICFSIGYKDPNYFSRVFKKQTGLTPTEFRRATVC